MLSLDEVLDVFFEMMKDCVESITLPTGESFIPTFFFSTFILALSLVMHLFNIFTFIDWRGALVATVLLAILAIIERRGFSEISRLYRTAQSGFTAVKARATGSNSSDEAVGGANPGDAGDQEE